MISKSTTSIVNAIMTAELAADDYNAIVNAIKFARARVGALAKVGLRVGDKVEWNSKYGPVMSGTVTKVNQKNIKVSTAQGPWIVSAALIRKI